MLRRPAVAGTWYPASPSTLARDIDDYVARASVAPGSGPVRALLVPHAGLMYSGPVAGASFAAARHARIDAIVLVGPSHYLPFEGVAAWPDGAFRTPLGDVPVLGTAVDELVRASSAIVCRTDAHDPEHSLEMQLPFVARLFPGVPIVPLLMGEQTRRTVEGLAEALATVFRDRPVLLVASSDLSHFFDAATADRLDSRVAGLVGAFDAEGLMQELERYPSYDRGRYVMCGGGPAVSVIRAARALGASEARILARSHSGMVSGDNDRVVGYLAAAFAEAGPAA